MSDKDTIIALLRDKPIAYRPGLKRIAGSIGAAIMLSQAIYWQERVPRDDGWWWKTAEEWEKETALNLNEQRSARAKLRGTSFWGEKRKGIPARMWFKLDFDELVRVLREGLVPLSAEEIVERHKQDIAQIAKAGLMRARKIDAEAEYVNYSEIVLRDGAVCAICNEPITRGPGQLADCLHFHHQMPLSKGGKHAADNIVCAHAQCNLRQGNTCIEQKQQDRLGKDDKIAYAKQTNSESTLENTTDLVADTTKVEPAGEELLDEYLEPRKIPKQEPVESTGDWRGRLRDNPHLAWAADCDEAQVQLQREDKRGGPMRILGYGLDKDFGLRPVWAKKKDVRSWFRGLAACLDVADDDAELVLTAARQLLEGEMTVSDPWSLVKKTRALAAEQRRPQGASGAFFIGV